VIFVGGIEEPKEPEGTSTYEQNVNVKLVDQTEDQATDSERLGPPPCEVREAEKRVASGKQK